MPQRYSDDEMREILRRAIDAGGDSGEFEHEDLVAAAAEVGIDSVAVDRAARELQDESEALERVLAKQRKKRRSFFRSAATMAVINAFLFAVDTLTGGGATWFYWPLLGTSLMLAMSAIKVLPPMSDDTRDGLVATERGRIARRRARETRRLEKEADRRARKARRGRRSSVESAFESAVEEGVSALLGALATQIARVTSNPDGGDGRAPGEFHRYVAGEKNERGARAAVPRAPKTAEPSQGSAGPELRVAVDQAANEVVEEELQASRESRQERK
ncbi:MAG: 2TM domain-containing protein [Deltaproteobacteria bacterium]|nr:2TM domain-containing protein [Deltaproteobacteria bacterium]